ADCRALEQCGADGYGHVAASDHAPPVEHHRRLAAAQQPRGRPFRPRLRGPLRAHLL
ncbi:hypothetical protein EV177_006263, partial [Coemansia sp. RSA 1804]